MRHFRHESVIRAEPSAVYAFHERPDALAILTPPWDATEIIQPPASLAAGTVVVLRTRLFPGIWVTIEAEHTACTPGVSFEDTMRRGPFPHWRHLHLFLPHPQGCLVRDDIEYAPPLGILGWLAEPVLIRPRLRRMFEYRHEATRRAVEPAGNNP